MDRRRTKINNQEDIVRLLVRKFFMWIFKNEWIPLGFLAPYVLGLGLGSRPH